MSRFACDVTPTLIVNGEDVSANIQYNEFTGRVTYTPAQPFNPGQVVVAKFQAVDCVGLQGESILLFALNVPPAISELSPRPDGATNERTVRVAAKLQDVEGFDPQSVILNIDEIGQNIGTFNVYNNEVSYISELPEGLYHASVAATDIFGASVTGSWSFIVDRTPPQISNTCGTNNNAPCKTPSGYLYQSSSAVDILTATWTDGPSGSGLRLDGGGMHLYKLSGSFKQILVPEITEQANGWMITLDAGLQGSALEGRNTVFMAVSDKAGNINTTEYWDLQIDLHSPDITPVYPMHNAVVKGIASSNPIVVSFSDEGAGIDANTIVLKVWDENGNIVCQDTANTPGCACSYANKTLRCGHLIDQDGAYTVTVAVADAVGNNAEIVQGQWAFRINTQIAQELSPAIRHFQVAPIENIVMDAPALNMRIGDGMDRFPADTIRVAFINDAGPVCETTAEANACNCTIDTLGDSIVCEPGAGALAPDTDYLLNVFGTDAQGVAYSRTWQFRWSAGSEPTPPDDLVLMSPTPRQIDARLRTPLAVTYWLDTDSLVSLDVYRLGVQLETVSAVKPLAQNEPQAHGYHIIAPIDPSDASGAMLAAGAYKFSMAATLNDPVCGAACPQAVLADGFKQKPQVREFSFSGQLNPVMNEPLELDITLDEPGQLLFQVGIEDGALFAEPLFWQEYPAGKHVLTWDGRAEGTPYMLTPEQYFYIVYQLALYENSFLVFGNEHRLDLLTQGALSVNPASLSPVRVEYSPTVDARITAKLVDENSSWEAPLRVLVQNQSAPAGTTGFAEWDGTLVNSVPAPQGLYTIVLESVSQSDPSSIIRKHITVGSRSPIMRVKDGVLYIVPNPGEIVFNVTQTDDSSATAMIAESTTPSALVQVPVNYFESGEHTFTATFYNTVTQAPPYTISVISTFKGGDAQ